MGKTSLYKRHFEPVGYEHVNQDTLKTKARCLNAIEAALKAGQSVVVGTFLPQFR
jgi:bifunctional polynucleotide phosphatase/kinase